MILVVLAVAVGLGVSCNGFREDEIECEQAVVHLRDCCPNFRANEIDCSYKDRLDCSDNVTARENPAFSIEDSRCIQNKSCAALVAGGDCGRAQRAKLRVVVTDAAAASTSTSTSTSTPPAAPICTP